MEKYKLNQRKEIVTEEEVSAQGWSTHTITVCKKPTIPYFKLNLKGVGSKNEIERFVFTIDKRSLEELKQVIDKALKISE